MKPETSNDRYITIAELRAKLSGRARSAIYGDVEARRLPKPMKLGNRLYWRESAVDEAMSELQQD